MLYNKMYELLAHKFRLFLVEEGAAKLEERAANMSIDVVTDQCPNGTVVLKCPTSQEGFFALPYTKICDYIIFIPQEQQIKVVFVELKKTLNTRSINHAKEQLLHTVPLLSYITSGLRIHHNYSGFRIKNHYILLFKQKSERFDKQSMHYNDSRNSLLSEKHGNITIRCLWAAHQISVSKIIKICESNA